MTDYRSKVWDSNPTPPEPARHVHPDALLGVQRYGGDLTSREQLQAGASMLTLVLMRYNSSIRQVVRATTRTGEDVRLLRDRLWASDESIDLWRLQSTAESATRRQLRRERHEARVAAARRAAHVAGEVLLIFVLAGVLVFLLTWYAGG